MWRNKKSDFIKWIDIDDQLRIPPDIVLDCTNTRFPDQTVSTIFYDPPHWWGDKTGNNLFTCRNKEELKKFLDSRGFTQSYGNTYYGTDKFKTKTQLLSFIHKSQKEFYRILRDDGVLWLIWSEVKIPLNKILPFFKDWTEMIRLHIASPLQSFGDSRNFWIMFMKKPITTRIMSLSDIPSNNGKEASK